MPIDYFAVAVANARRQFVPAVVTTARPSGPKDCCADFARVVACNGRTDTWECPFCGHRWTAPCR